MLSGGLKTVEMLKSDAELQEEYVRQSSRTSSLSDEWHKRWVFSLSIGNGVSLLSAGSALLEDPRSPLILSAWLFLFGLLAAGFLPFLLHRKYAAHSNIMHYKAKRISKDFAITEDGVKYTSRNYFDTKQLEHGRL